MAVATQKLFKRFTAVDLVTLAVFGALYRACWYIWQIFGALFPFNIVLATLFSCLTTVAAVVIVRKFGSFFLCNLAAQLVNFFFQGEALTATIVMILYAILPELYVYSRLKAGADPFGNLRDMLIGGTLFSASWVALTWGIVFPVIFLMEFSLGIWISVSVACFVGGIVGAWLGYILGDRIKGLIS
jgi:hypothetical protein